MRKLTWLVVITILTLTALNEIIIFAEGSSDVVQPLVEGGYMQMSLSRPKHYDNSLWNQMRLS
jgi:hypothetical protein